MDSLMAVELRNRLLGQFVSAFTMTATSIFGYPTSGSLAEYLAGQVPELVSPPGEVGSGEVAADGHTQ